MLGDTAVAVNPDDPRADALVGAMVRLPIVGRLIPIVADDYVVLADPDSSDAKARYATGFLKVTPAHDPNDWEIGLRHDLPVINVMGPDGAISDHGAGMSTPTRAPTTARAFVGLSREDARRAVVDWFDANGLLEEVRPYTHSVGHSYRSHVPIEPWLSDQWYVAVTDDRLRGSALRALDPDQAPRLPDDVPFRGDTTGDGELRFHPDRYARTYHAWHDTIRDWCISRQLWWGHQIPVWVRVVEPADAAPEVREALAAVDGDDGAPVELALGRRRRRPPGSASHRRQRRGGGVRAAGLDAAPPPPLDASLDEAALVEALESRRIRARPRRARHLVLVGAVAAVDDGLALACGPSRDRRPARRVQSRRRCCRPPARSSRSGSAAWSCSTGTSGAARCRSPTCSSTR